MKFQFSTLQILPWHWQMLHRALGNLITFKHNNYLLHKMLSVIGTKSKVAGMKITSNVYSLWVIKDTY